MTNREIAALWNVLNSREVAGLKGAKFAFAVVKNKATIKPTIDALETVQNNALETIKECEKSRIELCEEYADKDENGKPKHFADQDGGERFSITERREGFDQKLNTLIEKHREEIEEKKRLDKEFSELLDDETEVSLHAVKLSDVPDDITVGAMQGMAPMIAEE
jgi:vacuolar-type H+-ATPase subunit I/STV1